MRDTTEDVFPMAYQLLYSRNISSDARARWLDVPVTSMDIMVDIISVRSQFSRIAGWIYPIVSDGLIDYERGAGTQLLFGKTRLAAPTYQPPYFFEFFPKWGFRSGIVSIYTGRPSPPPSPENWRAFPDYNIELKFVRASSQVLFRRPIGAGDGAVILGDVAESFVWSRFLFWKSQSGGYFSIPLVELSGTDVIEEPVYLFRKSEATAVTL